MTQATAHRTFEPLNDLHHCGKNTADIRASEWPSVRLHSPVATLHILAVPSWDAVTTEAPSGEKVAVMTLLECPDNVGKRSPVATLIIAEVLSSEAVATSAPS